jgi:hypothetical protein
MKVKIEMTVEVNPTAWANEYGLDPSYLKGIREDVRNYFINGVHESPLGQTGQIQVIR